MEPQGYEHQNPSLPIRLEKSPMRKSEEPSTTSWSKKGDGREGSELALESATPEKKPQLPLHKRIASDTAVLTHNKTVDLPKKYESIVEFFDQMICSIRLLNLRKKLTTFQNISSQLEVLTKKSFHYSHLAQIKYLFPEAIEIEKILIHDKTSLCMVPELKISLSAASVEDLCVQNKLASVEDLCIQNMLASVEDLCIQSNSLRLMLHQVFNSRLLEFINHYQEHIDIPEAELPDHFNARKEVRSEATFEETSKDLHSTSIGSDVMSSISFLMASSCKQGPEKVMVAGTMPKSHLSSPASELIYRGAYMVEENCSQNSNGLFQTKNSAVKLPSSPKEGETHCFCETTPVKPVSCLSNLQVLTPEIPTPKIPNTTGLDNNEESETRPSARRLLVYSPSKMGGTLDLSFCEVKCSSYDRFSSHNLTGRKGTSSQGELMGKIPTGTEMLKDYSGIAPNGASGSQKMLASLPDLFDMIRIIFQSSSHTITKQELLHKLLLHNVNIEEPNQAEELLHLMEKMIPDWISTKTTSSGDLLYSIESSYDTESIRAKLGNAL